MTLIANLILSTSSCIIGSAHRLTEMNIWQKLKEILLKGSEDNGADKKVLYTDCDLDLESV